MTPARRELPEPVAPMLASAGAPPSGPGWAFEFKWDGVRAIAAIARDRMRLYSRIGNDITGGYPELAQLSELIGGRPALFDGEIVACSRAGGPDYALLQQRMHVRSPSPELVAQIPISYSQAPAAVDSLCHPSTTSSRSTTRRSRRVATTSRVLVSHAIPLAHASLVSDESAGRRISARLVCIISDMVGLWSMIR